MFHRHLPARVRVCTNPCGVPADKEANEGLHLIVYTSSILYVMILDLEKKEEGLTYFKNSQYLVKETPPMAAVME